MSEHLAAADQLMADKLIGRMFARAKNTQEEHYVAGTKDNKESREEFAPDRG